MRLRDVQARDGGGRGGADRVLPRADGALQGTADSAVRAAAENIHGGDVEVCAAGEGAEVGGGTRHIFPWVSNRRMNGVVASNAQSFLANL